MSENIIFVVEECFDYEGCDSIVSFSKKEYAENFIKIVEEYDRGKPEFEDAERVEWEKCHPMLKYFECGYRYLGSLKAKELELIHGGVK